MKKLKYFLILIFFVFGVMPACASQAGSPGSPDIKNAVTIPKGTFFKVINQRQLSSATLDEGDTVTFINSEPTYIGDNVLFPQNSIFVGTVEKINEPVEGVNAVLKIQVTKVITPENREIAMSAYVWSDGNSYLGGTLTPAKYYKTTPHYIAGLKGGVLQYTPTSYRYMGQHVVIKPGTELLLLLNTDLIYQP